MIKTKLNLKQRKKRWYRYCVFIICAMILFIPNMYIFKYMFGNKNIVTAGNGNTSSFVVTSYNIRCWTFLDIGKRSWFYRASLVLQNLSALKPDIIGFQEVTSGQYNYLKENMEMYNSVIEYRDNTPWSEGCPIFFNENRYELIETQTFWLSETPDTMSKAWGAANYRICTYVILFDKQTDSKIAVFNTHLDHRSEEARVNGINVISERINMIGDMPIVLLGDFNSSQSSETYKYVTSYFNDSWDVASESIYGSTYQNWGKQLSSSPIDYIMLSPEDFFVERYYIGNQVYNEVYPSDHFPICARLELLNKK